MINKIFKNLWTIYTCVVAIIFIIAVIYAAVANIYVWPFQWYRFGLDALLMSTWGGIIMNKLNDLEDIKKKEIEQSEVEILDLRRRVAELEEKE